MSSRKQSHKRWSTPLQVQLGFERLEQRLALSAVSGIDLTVKTGKLDRPISESLAAPLSAIASIHGRVFADVNHDGVFDSTDFGIPDIKVYLDYDNSTTMAADEPFANTDSSGMFELPTDVNFQSRDKVRIIINSSWVCSGASDGFGWYSTGATFATFSTVEVATQLADHQIDIGLAPPVILHGKVYEDLNSNLTFDDGDRPVDKLQVVAHYLIGGVNSTPFTPINTPLTTLTSTNGTFAIGDFVDRSASQLDHFLDVGPALGAGHVWQTIIHDNFTKTARGIIYDVDIAVRPFQTVRGVMYLDANPNNVRDVVRPFIRPGQVVEDPVFGQTSRPDAYVRRDVDGTFGNNDVAATTLPVTAAVVDSNGNVTVVGDPALSDYDGSFRLRVPVLNGQTLFVLPNLDPVYWKVSFPRGGVSSFVANLKSEIINVSLGVVPLFGIDGAVQLIHDQLFILNFGAGSENVPTLDQSQIQKLQNVSASLPSRITEWRQSVQRENSFRAAAAFNTSAPPPSDRRGSLEFLPTSFDAITIAPLRLTRDLNFVDLSTYVDGGSGDPASDSSSTEKKSGDDVNERFRSTSGRAERRARSLGSAAEDTIKEEESADSRSKKKRKENASASEIVSTDVSDIATAANGNASDAKENTNGAATYRTDSYTPSKADSE